MDTINKVAKGLNEAIDATYEYFSENGAAVVVLLIVAYVVRGYREYEFLFGVEQAVRSFLLFVFYVLGSQLSLTRFRTFVATPPIQ